MDTSSVNQQLFSVAHNTTFGVAHNTTLKDKQPSLDEVLNNDAPHPYSLESFTTYMSQKHCLEILEFILEGRRYRHSYEVSSVLVQSPITPARRDSRILLQLWQQILSTYIIVGSPREINLGSKKRHDLLAYHDPVKPPAPAALDGIEEEMLELLSVSIFPSFLKQILSTQRATAYLGAPYGNATVCISSAVLSPRDGRTEANEMPFLDTLAVRTHESYVSFKESAANRNSASSSLPFSDFSRTVDIHSRPKVRRSCSSKLRAMLGLQSRNEKECIPNG